ncbi:MAG: hypothetical protein REI09_05150 [Candidatus Dactylopiibacterium sp.]|nr:hypothetical protein [Candidatus Dactylopiibacterium sp.]
MSAPVMLPGWVRLAAPLAALAAVALGAYLLGVHASAPQPEVISPAVAQSQPDGSVVAARAPASSPAAAGKAPHQIPRGAVEERRVSVTVKPHAPAPGAGQSSPAEPASVRVDLSLIRQGEGRRVVASSPDGDIVGALDVPIEPALMPVSRPWAAGLSCEPSNCQRTPGAWVDRDLGRVRLGAEVLRQPDGRTAVRARAGWAW